jgi:predicted CoA-binding protein
MTTKEILQKYKKIAVVGLSSDPGRASFGVSRYMQNSGYEITPVNPNEVSVLGEKAFARLDEVPDPIEIVDIFRRSEFVPDVVDSAIRRGARVIWMQLGVVHEEAAQRARTAGLDVVMDLCILQEHMKYFGFGKKA